jgi:hypothetical protein
VGCYERGRNLDSSTETPSELVMLCQFRAANTSTSMMCRGPKMRGVDLKNRSSSRLESLAFFGRCVGRAVSEAGWGKKSLSGLGPRNEHAVGIADRRTSVDARGALCRRPQLAQITGWSRRRACGCGIRRTNLPPMNHASQARRHRLAVGFPHPYWAHASPPICQGGGLCFRLELGTLSPLLAKWPDSPSDQR